MYGWNPLHLIGKDNFKKQFQNMDWGYCFSYEVLRDFYDFVVHEIEWWDYAQTSTTVLCDKLVHKPVVGQKAQSSKREKSYLWNLVNQL